MPWNFIARSLFNFVIYFAVLFPVLTAVVDIFWQRTDLSFSSQIIVGPVIGLFFGSYQVFLHFRQINELVGEVNEDTVKPVREFETILDEKISPAMELLEERLEKKGWKMKEADHESGHLIFSANKHRGLMPYKFEIQLLARNDGKTFLQFLIKAPFFDNLFPDLGKSLQYLKEFKTVLL